MLRPSVLKNVHIFLNFQFHPNFIRRGEAFHGLLYLKVGSAYSHLVSDCQSSQEKQYGRRSWRIHWHFEVQRRDKSQKPVSSGSDWYKHNRSRVRAALEILLYESDVVKTWQSPLEYPFQRDSVWVNLFRLRWWSLQVYPVSQLHRECGRTFGSHVRPFSIFGAHLGKDIPFSHVTVGVLD